MQKALEGLKVIDLAQLMAGPGVSLYLGDQGADVIKIEPLRGDASRHLATNGFLKENSPIFMVFNRNKRGIALDINTPEGKEILLKLIAQADVLITNIRGSVAERQGLDYPALQAVNPRLVYASISGYGTEGPYAERPAYDRMTQGLSGAMHRLDSEGAPITAGLWISDCSIPMMMSFGIMAALWAREKTGVGQKVETSLLQAAIAMQADVYCRVEEGPEAGSGESTPSYGGFRCSDDRFLNVGALTIQHFQRLCNVMDLPHLADDPRLNDPDLRSQLRAEVFPIIEALFATRPSAEWQVMLDEVDVPCAPILPRSEVFDEPQMVANDMFLRVDHPEAGPTTMIAPPLKMSDTPAGVRSPAPLLGQHTEEILMELGYDGDKIAALRTKKVI